VLALANQRLDDGSLTSPANDNARYYFQLALSNDPGNAAAQTGLTVVASKIVLQAREEIDGGRFNTAEALLAEARQLDPASDELAASTKALTDARQRIADDQRRVAAEQQAAAEREAADRRAEEERQAAARRAEEQRLENERLAAEVAAAAAVAAAATQAAAEAPDAGGSAPDTDSAGKEEPAAGDAGEPVATAEPVTTTEPVKEEAVQPVPVSEQQPVAVSSLTRVKYVAPKYPRSAERRNISGWVEVVFTVALDGSVKDVQVINSQPGDRMMFALE
jgi:outer membrane biosynthesis protein TonB